MKKPNLIIVGAAKCGTTSLHNYLNQHPEIFMSYIKEPRHFCSDFFPFGSEKHFKYKDEKTYLKLFEKGLDKKIVGESTPLYLYSKKSAKEIHEFNPDAKVIIMLRDPLYFMYSFYFHMRHNLQEEADTFKEALDKESYRKENSLKLKTVDFLPKLFYKERATFSTQIERFLNEIPKEQIMVILFEDFRDDIVGVFKEVLEFLEVDDTEFKADFVVYNSSKSVKNKQLHRVTLSFINMLRATSIGKILPRKFRINFGNFTLGFSRKYEKKPPMDAELKESLKREFAPEVEKLNKLLHENGLIRKDLIKLWGYDKIENA